MGEINFSQLLLPAAINSGFRIDEYWIWCGSVVRDAFGKYHMYASMWEKSVPFRPYWLTNSKIVHATSDNPSGPYALVGDVFAQRDQEYWDAKMTHNPSVYKYGDKYILFYTGTTYTGERPTANNRVTREMVLEARRNQRIGLAIASSPYGPWKRPNEPCLDVSESGWDSYMLTNPAACIIPNGEIYLFYKSASSNVSAIKYGIAHSASLDEGFCRYGTKKPIEFISPDVSYEDAYVWFQEERFHMIFNDVTGKITGEKGAGAYAVSDDAIRWKLGKEVKAYSKTVLWQDSSVSIQGSLERPQLLIENNIPQFLFLATADGPGGFANAEHTWNIVIPLKG